MSTVRGSLFDLVIVRLADEGVPVKAMARAFKRGTDELYTLLRDAYEDGRIVALPAADWPVTGNRSERVPTAAIRRAGVGQIDDLVPHLAATFGLTPQESRFLSALIAFMRVTKGTLHTHVALNEEAEMKIVDVVACKLRKKLARHGHSFETLWGYGYAIDRATRDSILAQIAVEAA
ncbi:winged helix-turn-helix domain-containing protein [Salinarimonas sp. NSM]|uniref:winged helix-turn-helix domain-containing protein n=1 Tax=Salinarimonas sp. NSM TaxID=3458003 RepID=UPI00403546D0